MQGDEQLASTLHVQTLQACAWKNPPQWRPAHAYTNDASGGKRDRHARSQHRYSKMKVLFATLAVSITAHSVRLVQPQLTFEELMRPLVNNALCWARIRCVQGASVIHDYQEMQYYGSLVVDTPSDEITVLYDTGSSNL